MTEPNQETPESADSDKDLISAEAAEPVAEPNAEINADVTDATNIEEAAAPNSERDEPSAEVVEGAEPLLEPTPEAAEALTAETQAEENEADGDGSAKKRKKKKKPKKKQKAASPPVPTFKHEYKSRQTKGSDQGFQLSPEGLLRHFLGCRICCYFLSGVQVLYGREVLERMVHEFDGKWLEVPLTHETRSLMLKTYGLRLDLNDHYIDHACDVCCRRFVIDLPELEFETQEVIAEVNSSDQEIERIETAEEAMPVRRTIEEQVVEWNKGELPILLVEFKHRR